jgi:small subunit ribosomal protein S8
MSMSDPIADMLTRIRNGSLAKRAEVAMPSSRIKTALAEVLKEQGYIQGYRLTDEGTPRKTLTVELKYKGKRVVPVIEGIDRVSSPACRIYVGVDEIPRVLGGLGVVVLSTCQGLMTGRAAKQRNLGGEVICYVW